jgi:hypothetical protein
MNQFPIDDNLFNTWKIAGLFSPQSQQFAAELFDRFLFQQVDLKDCCRLLLVTVGDYYYLLTFYELPWISI